MRGATQVRAKEVGEGAAALHAEHPWSQVEKVDAVSHFPTFEVPGAIAAHLARFAGRL